MHGDRRKEQKEEKKKRERAPNSATWTILSAPTTRMDHTVAREEMTILLNDMWLSAVEAFGCVNSRIFWIKFKFSRVKICVVVGYGPNEGGGEETDRL